ncbi:MAG: hypothetical protein JRE64_00480 [Deltaproteobacteria bacterium]|nr:hypothetical protein [Deltaproteobacteria bacterium]
MPDPWGSDIVKIFFTPLCELVREHKRIEVIYQNKFIFRKSFIKYGGKQQSVMSFNASEKFIAEALVFEPWEINSKSFRHHEILVIFSQKMEEMTH